MLSREGTVACTDASESRVEVDTLPSRRTIEPLRALGTGARLRPRSGAGEDVAERGTGDAVSVRAKAGAGGS